jgi:hypothetical protein
VRKASAQARMALDARRSRHLPEVQREEAARPFPCPAGEQPMMMTPERLADAILEMTYGDLKEVGRAFVDMVGENNNFDITSPNDFADLLHQWAEGLDRGEDQNRG